MGSEETPSVYRDIGVMRAINARSSSTVLGGSIISPVVLSAMYEANRTFVAMPELLKKAGETVADMVGAEAAYVTPGCYAAIGLGVSGMMTGTDLEKIGQLPDSTNMRNRFLIQKCARYRYDRSATVSGAKLVEVGSREETTTSQFEEAINGDTAGIIYPAHLEHEPGIWPLSDIVSLARDKGLGVLVDAAYRVYPLSLISDLACSGADLVCFSAKYMGGPNTSGFLCGRVDAVEAARLNGFMAWEVENNWNAGRGYKMDRGDIIATVVALREWLELDHRERIRQQEQRLEVIAEALIGLPYLRTEQGWFDGYCSMEMKVYIDEVALGRSVSQVEQSLRTGQPGIWVWDEGDALKIGVDMLQEGDEYVLARRLREVLDRKRKP